MSALRSVDEHLADILAAVRPLDAHEAALAEALGRTLADAVRARVDIPGFDNSAMDGFAVRAADVHAASADHPVLLRVVADLPAGSPLDPSLRVGEAARIMTGAPVPADADAVVPFEDTAQGLAGGLGEAAVLVPPRPGAHIRRRAEDLAAGTEVVSAGTLLGALQLGAAAAAGVDRVRVRRAPRVAVISTGSELMPPGTPLQRGQIPESNSELLAGLVAQAGAEVTLRASVPDDLHALRDVLTRAQAVGVDAVITSGGVSAGAYEVVKDTLAGTLEFVKVAMQPGKPQGFGMLPSSALMFALPGNPVSVAVSFEAFVRPALLAMQARTELHRPLLRLPAGQAWRTPPGRRQYLPAALDRTDPARWMVRPATAGGSGSHLAGGLAQAEAYAVIAEHVPAVAAGDPVDVMLIS